MQAALTKRVLDMLKNLSGDEEKYRTFWEQFGPVLKEGVIEDQGNRDKLARLLRFATTHTGKVDQDQSLDDYLARAGDEQDKIYYVLADSHTTALASPHLEKLKAAGIEVLLLTDRIDPWLVDGLREYEGKALVDAASADLDLPDSGQISAEESEKAHKPLLKKVRRVLADRVETVTVSQRLVESPACVVTGADALSPQLKRMLEASGQVLPETKPVLEINVDHPLVKQLDAETADERFAALANIVLDHALLAEGSQLDNPAEYVQRINRLILDMGTQS
jgi:molecular chaperone HtpG